MAFTLGIRVQTILSRDRLGELQEEDHPGQPQDCGGVWPRQAAQSCGRCIAREGLPHERGSGVAVEAQYDPPPVCPSVPRCICHAV